MANKADMKKMFEAVDAAQEGMNAAQSSLDEAADKRSAAVKRIHDEIGTGPFEYKGQTLTIRKRDTKDKDTGAVVSTNYFFVTLSGEVTKIG